MSLRCARLLRKHQVQLVEINGAAGQFFYHRAFKRRTNEDRLIQLLNIQTGHQCADLRAHGNQSVCCQLLQRRAQRRTAYVEFLCKTGFGDPLTGFQSVVDDSLPQNSIELRRNGFRQVKPGLCNARIHAATSVRPVTGPRRSAWCTPIRPTSLK